MISHALPNPSLRLDGGESISVNHQRIRALGVLVPHSVGFTDITIPAMYRVTWYLSFFVPLCPRVESAVYPIAHFALHLCMPFRRQHRIPRIECCSPAFRPIDFEHSVNDARRDRKYNLQLIVCARPHTLRGHVAERPPSGFAPFERPPQ